MRMIKYLTRSDSSALPLSSSSLTRTQCLLCVSQIEKCIYVKYTRISKIKRMKFTLNRLKSMLAYDLCHLFQKLRLNR